MDLVDSLTAQFAQEIGPARDRTSSQRHEKWVFAAGGAIRGLKTTRDGQPWVRACMYSTRSIVTELHLELIFVETIGFYAALILLWVCYLI